MIHAVGPIGEDAALLRSACAEALKDIDGSTVRSIGLCCISTGIYGYPIRPTTHIALDTAGML
jgi:O-acetyl-ADP-ribose deacetylase (regulator of RNase III)